MGSGGYLVVDNAGFAEFSGESIGGVQVDPCAFHLGHSKARKGARIGSTNRVLLAWQRCRARASESLSDVPAVVCVVPGGTPETTRNRS